MQVFAAFSPCTMALKVLQILPWESFTDYPGCMDAHHSTVSDFAFSTFL